MDARRVIGGVGRTLIAAGSLILLFVAYQLWGTGLAEARGQRKLTRQFEQVLRSPAKPAPPSPAPGTPDPEPAPPPAPVGDAVAMIRIPKIGLEKAIVQGVGLSELKKAPGHYPTTPMPGEPGNAAIAGHRTTYGAPFFNLDELKMGDPILVTTRVGEFRYEVTESKVVSPKETSVLQPTDDNRLTLTTCQPRFSAAQRLIVVASLKSNAVDLPEPAAPPDQQPAVSLEESEADLSGAGASNGPAIFWGFLAGLVWLGTWLAARRWRKLPAYLIGTPVFLVVLFVFFENFSRLLPANF
ncbi:MAG TPA: class E sortase [Acidimicrobiales bacterium]|nr:class E sortase [Acidimicrobiales bacterium]